MRLDTLKNNFVNHKTKIAKDLIKFLYSNTDWKIEIFHTTKECDNSIITYDETSLYCNGESIDYYYLVDVLYTCISNSDPFYDISNKTIRFDIR